MYINNPSDRTSRLCQPDLWSAVPDGALANLSGFHWFDDFTDHASTKWKATQATAGSAALTDGHGGLLLVDSGSTTQGQGLNFQLGETNGECILPAANDRMLFEARIQFATISSGIQMFVGLAETDTTILASNANSLSNGIGFLSLSDTAVVEGYSEKATAAGDAGDLLTPAASTWYHLIFRYGFKGTDIEFAVVTEGTSTLTWYTLAGGTYLPLVELRPSIVVQSRGTVQPTVTVDYMRYAQWTP